MGEIQSNETKDQSPSQKIVMKKKKKTKKNQKNKKYHLPWTTMPEMDRKEIKIPNMIFHVNPGNE